MEKAVCSLRGREAHFPHFPGQDVIAPNLGVLALQLRDEHLPLCRQRARPRSVFLRSAKEPFKHPQRSSRAAVAAGTGETTIFNRPRQHQLRRPRQREHQKQQDHHGSKETPADPLIANVHLARELQKLPQSRKFDSSGLYNREATLSSAVAGMVREAKYVFPNIQALRGRFRGGFRAAEKTRSFGRAQDPIFSGTLKCEIFKTAGDATRICCYSATRPKARQVQFVKTFVFPTGYKRLRWPGHAARTCCCSARRLKTRKVQ